MIYFLTSHLSLMIEQAPMSLIFTLSRPIFFLFTY
ncbi:hypothetical protein AHYW_003448 [Providencia manganoxydans]